MNQILCIHIQKGDNFYVLYKFELKQMRSILDNYYFYFVEKAKCRMCGNALLGLKLISTGNIYVRRKEFVIIIVISISSLSQEDYVQCLVEFEMNTVF